MADKKEKQYVSDNPRLMSEWDWENNTDLNPSQLTLGSHIKVWWHGKCEHRWIAQIKARNKGTNCPICDGKVTIAGINDLATIAPHLASEWNWNKNKNITPSQVTIGSHKKVWWICKKGHEWETQVKCRTKGNACPICAGKTIISGINDLQTLHFDIASEWDSQKNTSILPSQIAPNSHIKVWWKCKNGHTWQASPNHRISKGRGCPYCCHNPQVLPGENDLTTIHPKVACEWHPTKNGTLKPSQVTANSSKSVWWKCSKGHEWKTAINHRADGSGCPKCAKSMQTSFPEQAIYYYVKNAYPDAINGYTALFNKHGMELDIYIPSIKVGIEYDGIAFHRSPAHQQRDASKYEICKKNNILLIRIREDLEQNVNEICDYAIFVINGLDESIQNLSKHLPRISNVNTDRDDMLIRASYYSELEERSLSHLYPNIAQEWNHIKNGELAPNMVLAHSNMKVWWICSKGHEWKTAIDSRTHGNGCPYCSNRLVLPQFNDLIYRRPDLIKEWDYAKNDFSPSSITPGSGKKAWWICSNCGHSWLAEISSRNKGHGCPKCNKPKRKK